MEVSIVSVMAGSTSQLRADAIAEVVRLEHPDWLVVSRAAGGEARVVAERLAGDADFFFTNGGRRLEITVQKPLHQDIDYETASSYRIVMPSSVMHMHLLVRKDTGITSLRDIIDLRMPFRLGSGAGMTKQLLSVLLEYCGADLEMANSWGVEHQVVTMASVEGAEALQSGRIDVGFTYSSIPNASIAGCTADIALLPVDEPDLLRELESWGLMPTVIPAGTYSFVKEDIPTAATVQSVSVRTDMPDEVVYEVLAAVFKHMDRMEAAQADIGRLLTQDFVAHAVRLAEINGEPYHPGALRFYRELGWIP
jgi:TRAP transporter TAXI family solute receptor